VAAIQPCALLLLIGPDWRVETISANAGLIGQGQPETLLGRPLSQLIGSNAIHALRNRMSWLSGDESGVHDFGVRWGRGDATFDVHARRQGDHYLVEAEQAVEGRLPDGIGMAQSLLDRITTEVIQDIAEQGMRQLSALTGFQRLVLRSRDGAPLAHSQRNGLTAPVSERSTIPGEATRIIADRDAESVPLIGKLDSALLGETIFPTPTNNERELLTEQGVRGTMTLPLRIDGQWVGSIEAQHATPRRCSAERRAVAGLFGERLAARMARHGWTT
jgi:light-regulated signal transduction histidine kinase (bacteriophytochrome)